jgi:glucosyl-dolichyl phosphate glucuronosyltransferase
MKASIILATYKRVPLVKDTLTCLINQEYPEENYEIIIVDNSFDQCIELERLVRESLFQNIIYLHEPKNGATNARHTGVRHSKGEVLIFIDDDVLFDKTWLIYMLNPFKSPKTGLVAGKVVLKYEVYPPPSWILQFNSYLSGLDYGEKGGYLEPYSGVYSCNMAIRANVFSEVKGLNVCYYGDEKLLYLSGDGESGLAKKVYDSEYLVWYSPEAMVLHRVIKTRISISYMHKRAVNAGIETVYRLYRYNNQSILLLCLKYYPKFIVKCNIHRLLALFYKKETDKRIKHYISSTQHYSSSKQLLILLISKSTRNHTKRKDYL